MRNRGPWRCRVVFRRMFWRIGVILGVVMRRMRMKLRRSWICRMRLCFILGSRLWCWILMRLFLWGCYCLIFGILGQEGRCIFGWIRCWGRGDFCIGFIMRVWAASWHAVRSSHRAWSENLPDNSIPHLLVKVTLSSSRN